MMVGRGTLPGVADDEFCILVWHLSTKMEDVGEVGNSKEMRSRTFFLRWVSICWEFDGAGQFYASLL